MAAGRRAMGATPPVPEDSLPSLGVGRGPVPVYVTAKDDYLVLRTVRGGVAGAGQGVSITHRTIHNMLQFNL
jgi:hypothetical protein